MCEAWPLLLLALSTRTLDEDSAAGSTSCSRDEPTRCPIVGAGCAVLVSVAGLGELHAIAVPLSSLVVKALIHTTVQIKSRTPIRINHGWLRRRWKGCPVRSVALPSVMSETTRILYENVCAAGDGRPMDPPRGG